MKRLLFFTVLLALAACAEGRSSATALQDTLRRSPIPDSAFAALVERLSEPGGYFDTDNLISNERSYLHVMGALEALDVRGGAYIGVGPDQNFAYIAGVRPAVAFIIDIRRDNMLQHLMLKALFDLAETRVEYLALLHGRPPPADAAEWSDRSIEDLVEYIDGRASDPDFAVAAMDRVAERAASYGVPLSAGDSRTIRAFHAEFIRDGLDLRFRSHGRRPRLYYPTYRQLLLERDLSGRRASYLAEEGDFQFVKSMQERNLIIPVVGDLAGDHALAAIGREIEARGLAVSALYTSNVEDYLMRGRTFDRFASTVASLPREPGSVIIRSYFGRNFGYAHPQSVPGYYSVQLLQSIESLVDAVTSGGYRGYRDLVTRGAIDLRAPRIPAPSSRNPASGGSP